MSEWGVDIGCPMCKHWEFKERYVCKAFPDGIPHEILSGAFDHRKIFPKQKNNIIFESK